MSGEGRAGLEGRLLASCRDGPNGWGHTLEFLLSLGTEGQLYLCVNVLKINRCCCRELDVTSHTWKQKVLTRGRVIFVILSLKSGGHREVCLLIV